MTQTSPPAEHIRWVSELRPSTLNFKFYRSCSFSNNFNKICGSKFDAYFTSISEVLVSWISYQNEDIYIRIYIYLE